MADEFDFETDCSEIKEWMEEELSDTDNQSDVAARALSDLLSEMGALDGIPLIETAEDNLLASIADEESLDYLRNNLLYGNRRRMDHKLISCRIC